MLKLIQQPHPLWGKSLDQYTHVYQIPATRRSTHGAVSRLLAVAAAAKISQLSDNTEMLESSHSLETITISTLEAVLAMAEDETTYKNFLTPNLISGCITLMRTIKVSGKPSPFCYEFGYLCFRIILVSLGVYLLDRSRLFGMIKENIIQSPDLELPLIFSSHVARVIEILTDEITEGTDWDWLIGWGPCNPDTPLISRNQVNILINLIWEDRTNFFRAMTKTYTPALSGILFSFWRHACLELAPATLPIEDTGLANQVTEIHFRCMLVVTTDQNVPMRLLAERLCEFSTVMPGDDTHMFPKSEDSRAIFEAYIARLAPFDTRLYTPIDITMIPVVLDLLISNMEPGLEELLPSIIGLTLDRLWIGLVNLEESEISLVSTIGMVLEHFKSFLKFDSWTNAVNLSIQMNILQACVDYGLLDLVATVLLNLDPNAQKGTTDHSKNNHLFSSVKFLFDQLAASIDPSLLEECFHDYAPMWIRVQHQFAIYASEALCGM
ncbi:unnamed protein product [Rhizoctonia solani]|uniref:Uncharacterized protein n=1 Tax=Rhizoctonia solani TaxID=456999 RepID=A0A8H2XWG8_9AGAM|nr:unnamed protein product [Rhizoctonia solani]